MLEVNVSCRVFTQKLDLACLFRLFKSKLCVANGTSDSAPRAKKAE